MCIDLLDSVERTLTDAPRECGYLVDTDDACICDDEEVEFIVDPIKQHEGQEDNPKE